MIKSIFRGDRRELSQWFVGMHKLLSAGVPLLQAMRMLAGRLDRGWAKEMLRLVEDGVGLSAALQKVHPRVDPAIMSLLATGEQTGRLVEMLGRVVRLREREEESRRRVWAGLLYPAILWVMMGGVFAVFMNWMIPKYMSLASVGISPAQPVPLWMQTEVARWAVPLVWLLLPLLLLLLWQWRLVQVDQIPLLGAIWRDMRQAREWQILATLLGCGQTLPGAALAVARHPQTDPQSKVQFGLMVRRLEEGWSVGQVLERMAGLDPEIRMMAAIGEHSGSLAESIQVAADQLDERAGERLLALGKMLEPAMILLMAMLIGGSAVVMLKPLMQLGTG